MAWQGQSIWQQVSPSPDAANRRVQRRESLLTAEEVEQSLWRARMNIEMLEQIVEKPPVRRGV